MDLGAPHPHLGNPILPKSGERSAREPIEAEGVTTKGNNGEGELDGVQVHNQLS